MSLPVYSSRPLTIGFQRLPDQFSARAPRQTKRLFDYVEHGPLYNPVTTAADNSSRYYQIVFPDIATKIVGQNVVELRADCFDTMLIDKSELAIF